MRKSKYGAEKCHSRRILTTKLYACTHDSSIIHFPKIALYMYTKGIILFGHSTRSHYFLLNVLSNRIELPFENLNLRRPIKQ